MLLSLAPSALPIGIHGIEKRFGPLLLYRGRMNRGHAHRLWNMVLLMMASEEAKPL